LENIKTDELDEDFVEEVENAVKAIYSQLSLKYIGPSTMKGIAFVKFLQNIVERMNSGTSTTLSISSEYESVIQFVAQEAIIAAVGKYKERMDILMNEEGKLPMLWEEFEEMHSECTLEAKNLFFEKIIGNPTKMEKFRRQLNQKLSKVKENFVGKNSEELQNYNKNVAKKFWEKYVKIRLISENLFKV